MFNEFPAIETERLNLRRMSASDSVSLFNILSDRDVTKDMGINPFVNVEQAEGLINFMNNLFERNVAFRCGIFRKEDDALIGTCS